MIYFSWSKLQKYYLFTCQISVIMFSMNGSNCNENILNKTW